MWRHGRQAARDGLLVDFAERVLGVAMVLVLSARSVEVAIRVAPLLALLVHRPTDHGFRVTPSMCRTCNIPSGQPAVWEGSAWMGLRALRSEAGKQRARVKTRPDLG